MPYGVPSAQATAPYAVSDDDVAFLGAGANVLGNAVERLRLEAELSEHPVNLDVGGLESALGAIAAQQGRLGGFVPDVRIDGAAHGARDALILSLARELLVNAAKHAGAGHVVASVRRDGPRVVLVVADDGSGMAEDRPAAALGEGHVGLASIRERVEAVGGRLALAGGPGDGTRVTIVLPG
jgi:two-component system NarL family sensor kinase